MFLHAHGSFGIVIARGMMMFAGLIGMLMQMLLVGPDMLEANVSYQDRRWVTAGGDLSSSAPETQLRLKAWDLYTHVSVHTSLFV